MPDFKAFPKSQQVTFKYHQGVLAFLEENYVDVLSPTIFDSPRTMLTGFRLRNI